MTPDLWMLVMVTAGLAASAWLGGMAGWVVRERRAEAEIANHAINNWQEGRDKGWTTGYAEGYRDGKNNRKRRDRDSARDVARDVGGTQR